MRELSLYGLSTRTPVLLDGRVDELEVAIRSAWSRCLDPSAPGAGDLTTEPVRVRLGPSWDASGADSAADSTAGDSAAGDAPAASGTEVDPLLQALTQQVTYAKIRAQAGRLLLLHASAAAHPGTGDAVAFVAAGGTGKTTLIRRLGVRYGYVTDETVGVDAAGLLHPYPKPLSIRRPAGSPGKAETSPDELGLLPAPEGARLRRLVLLRRDDRHEGSPTIEPLDAFAAIAALAPETSSLAALPRPLHTLADLLGGLDETVRLTYRDVHAVLDLIAGWLEAR